MLEKKSIFFTSLKHNFIKTRDIELSESFSRNYRKSYNFPYPLTSSFGFSYLTTRSLIFKYNW